MSRVLLIDIDSKIENLPLMKISAYHKQLGDEIAEQLAKLKCKVLHFAWDYDRDEAKIMEGIEVLHRHGINTKNDCRFYVYVEDDSQYDSGVRRCRLLKKHRCTPMGMVNPESKITKRLKKFQRWSCNAYLVWTCDIDNYDASIKGHTGMERPAEC